jgi:carboxyl-terminal processing protease
MWWKHAITAVVLASAGLSGSNVQAPHEQYIASLGNGATLSPSSFTRNSNIDPERLYHRVWHLIEDDFYDTNVLQSHDWHRWEHRYDGKLKTLDDSHVAIETMLASLGDRYTRFLDREAFDDEKQQIDAKLYGIGVQIGTDKAKKIIVIAPIEGTPASRAGLLPADEIAEIDGKSTKGWSVEEAAKHIRGELNKEVKLTLVRGKDRIKVAVRREEIPIKAVQTAKLIDGNVGYIRLSSFISQQATHEVREAITKLNGAKGIVLDLRDNPGGLLTNAIDISNLFLDSGNIVSTVDRDGYKTPALSDGKPLCTLPLVILINKGSASASEITSGALKDNGRATLIGQTTYGKGLVQGINRLEDGSGVNITIARYLTPSDTDINKKGIIPDVSVDLSDQDYKDGKGAWWLDPNGPTLKRTPEDMKDIQLKTAVAEVRKKAGDQSQTAEADGLVLKAQVQTKPQP